jgi:hypothetical protein
MCGVRPLTELRMAVAPETTPVCFDRVVVES